MIFTQFFDYLPENFDLRSIFEISTIISSLERFLILYVLEVGSLLASEGETRYNPTLLHCMREVMKKAYVIIRSQSVFWRIHA